MAIVIFGVGQLVLPSIAAQVVRGRVDRYGKVLSVSVSATPAIELAFGDADTVTMHMAGYRAPESSVARNLGQTGGVTNLNVRVDRVSSGRFSATDATLTKHGSRLVGTGSISEASLKRAIPEIQSVKLVGSVGGKLTLQATVDILIASYTGDFTVSPSGGKIVFAATGALGDLFNFTVWSDPKVRVTSLSGHSTPTGMDLSATAEMR